jgi:hypothetical protein
MICNPSVNRLVRTAVCCWKGKSTPRAPSSGYALPDSPPNSCTASQSVFSSPRFRAGPTIPAATAVSRRSMRLHPPGRRSCPRRQTARPGAVSRHNSNCREYAEPPLRPGNARKYSVPDVRRPAAAGSPRRLYKNERPRSTASPGRRIAASRRQRSGSSTPDIPAARPLLRNPGWPTRGQSALHPCAGQSPPA